MQVAHDSHLAPQRDAPRAPLLAAPPYLAAAALALAAGWAAGLTWPDRLVVPVALVILAAVKVSGRTIELHRRRAEADEWLIQAGRVGRFEWRVAELTSSHERRLLARSLHGVVRELRSNGLRSTVPLNRRALRPHALELESLADRLADLERPVEPAGMVEVERLLTSPGSPLYLHAPETDLGETLETIRQALEAR